MTTALRNQYTGGLGGRVPRIKTTPFPGFAPARAGNTHQQEQTR